MKTATVFIICSFTLLFSLATMTGYAQTPAWQMATGIAPSTLPTPDYSNILATAADAAGNVYVAGRFQGTVNFGAFSITSAGVEDAFVAKWSTSTRTFVWAQRFGGVDRDEATAVAVSGSNIYVTGFFLSPAAGFGTTSLLNAGSGSPRTRDAFVTKVVDNGTSGRIAWAQRAGGNDDDDATSVAVVGASIYFTGSILSATATFGSTTLTNAGFYDAFVAKLVDTGNTSNFVWVQQAGGDGLDIANGIAAVGNNVYITGYFSGGTPSAFGNNTLTSIYSSLFVAKLTDAGNTGSFVWAESFSGTSETFGNAIAVSGTSIYVAGFSDSGPALVAKFTDAGATGSRTWVQQSVNRSTGTVNAIAVSGTNIYVAGSFDGSDLSFDNLALNNSGTRGDVFVAKITDAGANGNFSWIQGAGGTDDDAGYAISVSGSSIYVGGKVVRPAAFGSYTVTSTTSSPGGFLASLTDGYITATALATAMEVVNFYPNPARTSVTIHVLSSTPDKHLAISIIDPTGKIIRDCSFITGQHQIISLEGLMNGLYTLRVQVGLAVTFRKLTVE